MSQDGRLQQIPKDVEGDGLTLIFAGECTWPASSTAPFVRCHQNHIHCRRCGLIAHRFRRSYTCGNGCIGKVR